MTNVAIIGLGNMGKALATRLAGRVNLVLGVNQPDEAAEFGRLHGVAITNPDDATRRGDIVVLAMSYDAALAFAATHDLAGKVVVDMSNPILPDYSGLKVSGTTSAAEEIQKAAPTAKVVKAFNTIFAGVFGAPRLSTLGVPVFVAGNDDAAVAAVAALVAEAGFAAELVGKLDGARLVEQVGMLNIRLGYGLGRGTDRAPAWVKVAA